MQPRVVIAGSREVGVSREVASGFESPARTHHKPSSPAEFAAVKLRGGNRALRSLAEVRRGSRSSAAIRWSGVGITRRSGGARADFRRCSDDAPTQRWRTVRRYHVARSAPLDHRDVDAQWCRIGDRDRLLRDGCRRVQEGPHDQRVVTSANVGETKLAVPVGDGPRDALAMFHQIDRKIRERFSIRNVHDALDPRDDRARRPGWLSDWMRRVERRRRRRLRRLGRRWRRWRRSWRPGWRRRRRLRGPRGRCDRWVVRTTTRRPNRTREHGGTRPSHESRRRDRGRACGAAERAH